MDIADSAQAACEKAGWMIGECWVREQVQMNDDLFCSLVRHLNEEFRDPSCRKPDAGTGIFTGGS